jgi:hypothetical protein
MSADRVADLLVTCARESSTRAQGELQAAATAIDDWDIVAATAARHRLEPMLEAAVANEAVPYVPADVRDSLRRLAATRVAETMLLEAEHRNVTASLTAAGVLVLVLKGAALASRYYPSPARRPYQDIDLAVKPEHLDRARSTLLANGYQQVPEQRPAHRCRRRGGPGARFHEQFVSGAHGALLELHGDILQLGVESLDESARWARSVPVPGMDAALMLSAEDQLVHLSVHALKHGFERLLWLKDLDLVLRRSAAALDWDWIILSARREGVAACVWYSLTLASAILLTPVPEHSLRGLRPRAPVRRVLAAAWPAERVRRLESRMHRRVVQFDPRDSTRGMLPSLIVMGRRGVRTRAIVSHTLGRP